MPHSRKIHWQLQELQHAPINGAIVEELESLATAGIREHGEPETPTPLGPEVVVPTAMPHRIEVLFGVVVTPGYLGATRDRSSPKQQCPSHGVEGAGSSNEVEIPYTEH